MAEFPALPLWTDAYLGDTTHLTTIEHGAYLLLLITAWRTRDGVLPDDDRLLARYTRMTPTQWKRMRPILADFFVIEGGTWTQQRLRDERDAVKQLSERQREKGLRSGEVRSLKTKGRHRAAVKSGSTGDEPDVNRKRTSPTPTPIEKERDKSLSKKTALPNDFEPELFGEGSEAAKIQDGWDGAHTASQLERFKDHHRKMGSKFADWQAAWGTWVRNSVNFRHNGNSLGSSASSGAGSDYLEHFVAKEMGRRN
jgi:uncharacterized protein YdaU (DUF1376 family)